MTLLKSMRILVTATSFGNNNPNLRTELEQQVGRVVYNPYSRSLSNEELAILIRDCDGIIAGHDVIDRTVIENANKLKVIARYGVGLDRVDLKAAKEAGIIVTYTPGANSEAVAELTIGLIISLARSIPTANSSTKNGEWLRLSGISLKGKTVGLLGFGAIGKQVARRLNCFNCIILIYDPRPDRKYAETLGVDIVPMMDVISKADFLSLHLPVLSDTRGLVNKDFLSCMKHNAFLINTARGELIDENALYEAIKGGCLRGAALDTFTKEPPDVDNPLLGLSQVIVTPHIGAHSDSATNAMGRMALDDCLSVLLGKPPKYPV